ncbi:MAG: DUF3794 domain-containing protein [Clostridia bacterium]|nr:DUF3794 domain-containing protein [Clostridia bacterium]
MSINAQYETYRYTGETCQLHAQSIVECRLSGSEIGSILAVQARAVALECTCVDGEVRYGGKLLVCVVYEDGEKKICRVERGAEFFHKAEGSVVTPACFAKTLLQAENITQRREGSGLYISVIVGADITVYGGKQLEYLSGGDGLIVKKEPVTLYKSLCVSGETEAEDEFEADYMGDILLHSENALVTHISANAGQINLEGELVLGVLALKEDNSLCAYERVVPFKMEIPCEDAFGQIKASARVQVKSAHLTAGVDEMQGKSKIVFSYALSADCFLHSSEEISVVCDAFSPNTEVLIKKEKRGGRYLTNTAKCVERVGGVASLSPVLDGEYALCCAVQPRVEIACKKSNGGFEAEGVLLAEVILRGAENSHRACTLSLPFVFPVQALGDEMETSAVVCGLNIRRKKDGTTEAEATLKVSLRGYSLGEWEYICEAKAGEEIPENKASVSVYTMRAGEDLWQVAKRLCRAPEELIKSNPDLSFPVKDGERLFVYRQIK